ncbi:ion transporter [Chryseolinea sp. T2]|uniref:ion transporter n=1 Tax=Chryseolinea sp. T2 TaxID=3129255 RepID=UPI003077048C
MTFRRRLYITLDPSERGGLSEQIFEFFLVIIIILNIITITIDSVGDIDREYGTHFRRFENFSLIFFTLEYIARIYSIVEKPKYNHPIKGRLKFAATPLAIIDLLTFLPFYLAFLPLDLRVLRIFRLMSLFRMFKIARYLQALEIFKRVIVERKEQLVLSFLFILFILVIISFAMYYVEHDAQPDKFSSIPAAMWWGIATLTTVGYGDLVPITSLGKFLGGIFAIAGVALLALPAGVLSSGFFELLYNDRKQKTHHCPHCGKEFHDAE